MITMKRKILISINPEHVKNILSGEKKYEYRKSIFMNDEIILGIVYDS